MIVAERPPGDAAVVRAAPETPGCASHARRWVLLATILGSSVAFMMASIINVALPAIQETYGATVAQMQWVASAYTVLLAALTLAGGALGDRFGRRRVFQAGAAGLALASIAGSVAAFSSNGRNSRTFDSFFSYRSTSTFSGSHFRSGVFTAKYGEM